MRNLLPDKIKHFQNFADAIYKDFRQTRFGIKPCCGDEDLDLLLVRKELVDYQSIEDSGALTEASIQCMSWLPIYYPSDDSSTEYALPQNTTSPYRTVAGVSGSCSVAMGYGTDGAPNLIQVNSGGCITNINLSPVVNMSTNTSFVYTQTTPSALWYITHNLNMLPNVRIEDQLGVDIEGAVTYLDSNTLEITFSEPVAGTAYLS